MCFDTGNGSVFMNIALRYNNRKREELRLNLRRAFSVPTVTGKSAP